MRFRSAFCDFSTLAVSIPAFSTFAVATIAGSAICLAPRSAEAGGREALLEWALTRIGVIASKPAPMLALRAQSQFAITQLGRSGLVEPGAAIGVETASTRLGWKPLDTLSGTGTAAADLLSQQPALGRLTDKTFADSTLFQRSLFERADGLKRAADVGATDLEPSGLNAATAAPGSAPLDALGAPPRYTFSVLTGKLKIGEFHRAGDLSLDGGEVKLYHLTAATAAGVYCGTTKCYLKAARALADEAVDSQKIREIVDALDAGDDGKRLKLAPMTASPIAADPFTANPFAVNQFPFGPSPAAATIDKVGIDNLAAGIARHDTPSSGGTLDRSPLPDRSVGADAVPPR